ncbi:MAG: PmoA family protein [Verrucomicrobia bacterium]|nr:PmoA family protein [Verrucomicrobiota bacterium]
MTRKFAVAFASAFVATLLGVALNSHAKELTDVKITELAGKLKVEINGRLFTEYHHQQVPRPFFYPLIGPKQLPMTRNWPMKDVPDEEHDHPHHRSLWFTHGDVNGVDFWSEEPKAGKIVHEKFLKIQSSRSTGTIKSQNKWIAPDGKVVCTDDRTFAIHARPDERLIDFEITIHASNGDLVFGDTKEGTMAIRLAETMRLKGKVGAGHIVNSEGVRDDATWGKRADWVDYYGPIQGQTVGVAIFDHPNNPMHPTWWHVRDYGLFAANPFGVHEFEKKPKGTGDFKVSSGGSVTFRYRLVLHAGDEKQADIAAHYKAFVSQSKSR